MECELTGFLEMECTRRMQRHHLVNKSRLRGNPEALAYCEANAWLFLSDVCSAHNGSRIADQTDARARLVRQKVEQYGEQKVRVRLDGLRALLRADTMDLRLEALLAAVEEDEA